MTKKVVHIITGLNDGGAEGVLTRLCLHSKGATHVVISLMDAGKYGPVLQQAGVAVHCLDMSSGKPSIVRFFQLIKLIRSEQPDVVQTWMYHADLLGGLAARMAGVQRLFWGIRHSTLDKGKSKRSTILIARLCALLSSWVPEKIVCCAHRALSVHRDIGYSASRLVVIANGYDLSQFTKDEQAGSALRASIGVPRGTFLIGNVGRYDPFKDHNNLLTALFKLKSGGVGFMCLLVGRGLSTDNGELMARIKELRLSDQIILAGQRTDIPAVMNALDLHVLSSSSEGFPNVLAEAMACATPAVSTNVGDAGAIVGDCRLVCPPQNAGALSELILPMHAEWSEKPDAWAERQNRCIQHIRSNFSIERMVSAYESCWFGD